MLYFITENYLKTNTPITANVDVTDVFPYVATQAQRTWVGLTDEDDIDWEEGGNLRDLVKAIEAKLKEKNNG